MLGNLWKYNLPVNSYKKHLLYLLNLYVTVNSLTYHYPILHVKLLSETRSPWKSATVDGFAQRV